MNVKKLSILSIYTTIALIIYVIEASLPALAPIPGIKLGLANVVTLFVLIRYSAKEAFMMLIVRIIISTIITGQAVSFIYSLCGGILCLIIMCIINKLLNGKYIFLTSIMGAVSHNTGQILAAYFILQMSGILVYIPYLIISGIITGLFTGLICYYSNKHIPHIY